MAPFTIPPPPAPPHSSTHLYLSPSPHPSPLSPKQIFESNLIMCATDWTEFERTLQYKKASLHNLYRPYEQYSNVLNWRCDKAFYRLQLFKIMFFVNFSSRAELTFYIDILIVRQKQRLTLVVCRIVLDTIFLTNIFLADFVFECIREKSYSETLKNSCWDTYFLLIFISYFLNYNLSQASLPRVLVHPSI